VNETKIYKNSSLANYNYAKDVFIMGVNFIISIVKDV
jgi:hypothetical protein